MVASLKFIFHFGMDDVGVFRVCFLVKEYKEGNFGVEFVYCGEEKRCVIFHRCVDFIF